MTLCPICGTDWPRNCMSAVAVELLGGCLWCRFGPVRGGDAADGDLERVREEYARRRARVEYCEVKRT